MRICKNSYHYNIWEKSCEITKGYIPGHTNLCSYFWRVVLSVLFLFPARKLWLLETWLAGFHRGRLKHRWALMLNVGMWLIFIYSIPLLLNSVLLARIMWGISACLILVIVMLESIKKLSDVAYTTGFWDVTKEYLKNKKDGICPLIVFEPDVDDSVDDVF